ncbi:hypothetical protein AQUCO_03800056v1 [Aquilegia coerulea]|uniref:AAA+ ATPase domain-containing protein n=1 Tax=Aquilegia coerulea TaxID=218851 RepID=A0A2G5CSF4_AQUCA|nr:hypothetical protein AQUCO_03800056v1 [Aquilegia coerulea]
MEYLMDPMIRIIGIYGMGGAGKTTIMMNINAQLATDKAYHKIIWVTLSKVLNLEDVQNEIAQQLHENLPKDMNDIQRAAKLFQMLKKLKFLILFDDIWEPIPLEKVGIPQPTIENGCNILMTTRSLEVCERMSTDKNIHVGGLSNQEAWDLFASKIGNQILEPDIRLLAREVIGECLSHPLLIITLGHALQDCKNATIWQNTLLYLRQFRQEDILDREKAIYRLLRFSFFSLKNITVQTCFLYCAFFPVNYLFEPNELIRYWLAENFINNVNDMVAEIYEGFKILTKLKDVGIFQVFKHHLRMHAMFRELAIDILQDQPGFFFDAGLGLKILQYGWEWAEARRVSLMRNRLNFLDDNQHSSPHLLTLLLKDNTLLYDVSPTFFNTMPSLKVLDISNSAIAELPSSVSDLVNLHALFLQNCSSLNKIPSIGNLKKLRFLNLRRTSIQVLPQGTEELVGLRFLDLSETTKLEEVQEGTFSSLSGLEELHLQGSRICTTNTPMAANCLKELRYLKCLSILTLGAVGFGDHLETIMCLQEQNLQRFTVNFYGSSEDVLNHEEDICNSSASL